MVSKIGPQILNSYSGPLAQSSNLTFTDPGSPNDIIEIRRRMGPLGWIFVRWTEGKQENWAEDLKDPERYAEEWFARHRGFIETIAACDDRVAFCPTNEVNGLDELHARCIVRTLRLLHSVGAHGGVGKWAVGWPQEQVIHSGIYDRAWQEMEYGDSVLGHWYWADTVNLAQNISASRGGPGKPWHNRLMFDGWLDGLVKYYDEIGRDYLPDLYRGSAWQRAGITAEQYLREIRMIDEFLASREDVIGGAIFAIGVTWDDKWDPYLCNEIWDQIVREQESWVATWEKLWNEGTPPGNPLGYPLPFTGRITATFSSDHWGLDLAAPRREEYAKFHGTPVLASHNGVLYFGDWHKGGYGLYAYIKGEQWHTLYAHLADRWPGMSYGEFVQRGQPIGKVGYSGYTRPLGMPGTHLHYGARQLPLDTSTPTKGYRDPLPFLSEAA